MAKIENVAESVEPVADLTGFFQSPDQDAMFWRPRYLEPSAWTEHLPFAFWLMASHRPKMFVELGTHHGTSYFGFCQAVERLGLDTQCYAVDTWKGDEHAGFFDEKIYARVSEHNKAQYSSFSRLVRSTFDEALPHFSDQSIDLLHIDGLHTLEAVTHDFESWLPKLSKNAVVIMHDSNVRERDFGVFKLSEALQKRYPSFEFVHGHGLAIVGVGPLQNDALQKLYAANSQEKLKRSVQDMFARLGRACADTFEIGEQKARAVKLSDELNRKKKEVDDVKSSLEKTKADLTTRTKDLVEARSKLQSHTEKSALERGQLDERSKLYHSLYIEAKDDLVKIQGVFDEHLRTWSLHARDNAQLEQKNLLLEQKNVHLNSELSEREQRLAVVTDDAKERLAKLEFTQNELAKRENELVRMTSDRGSELSALMREREEIEVETKVLRERLVTQERELNEHRYRAREDVLAADQAKKQLQEELSSSRQRLDFEIAGLRAEVQQLKTEKVAAEDKISEFQKNMEQSFSENAALKTMLQLSKDEMGRKDEEMQRLAGAAGLLQQQTEMREKALDEEVRKLQREKSAAHEELIQLRKEMEEVLAETTKHREILQVSEVLKNDVLKLEKQKNEALEEISQLKKSVDERFSEIIKLTELLQTSEEAIKLQKDEAQRLLAIESFLRKENEELRASLQSERKNSLTVESMLTAATQALEALENSAKQEQTSAIEQAKSELKTQIAGLKQQQNSEIQAVKSENERLKLENKKLLDEAGTIKESVTQRFVELATLTEMFETVTGALQFEKDNGKKIGDMLISAEERLVAQQSTHEKAVNDLRSQLTKQDLQMENLVRKMVDKASQESSANTESRLSLRIFAGHGRDNGMKDRKLMRRVQQMNKSGLFDPDWYLTNYPDVKECGMDPAEHYLRFGAAEMRDPGPLFNTEAYSAANPDVVELKINPLIHYLNHGSKEGRKIESSKNA